MVLAWEPIADLPDDWSSLTDGELGPLLQFWNDQRADLEQSGALAEFSKRLAREWSIETGQIEGVYDIDRGIRRIPRIRRAPFPSLARRISRQCSHSLA
jgi:hypothetical protein